MSGRILIPVRGSEEFVEVQRSDLPSDATEIIDILKAEIAPLRVWLQIAIEYYRQGKFSEFKQILDEGTSKEVEDKYKESKKERIAILSSLASFYIQMAIKERDKTKKEEYLRQATTNYNSADKIDHNEHLIWLGKGTFFLAKGSTEALQHFENVLYSNPSNTPALLGKACILYNKGNYESSLNCYRRALSENVNCPVRVRLGLGLCFFKLKCYSLAKTAFKRLLELEEDNVEAIVGLAILEMNSEKNEGWAEAMKHLQKAYKIDPTHPRVLNLLSTHFFSKKDYKKVAQLTKTAHDNSDNRSIKAESFYFLGRCFQAQEDYAQAFRYYEEAIKLWPDFVLAQYGYGQMCIYNGDIEKAIEAFESVLGQHSENYETLKILGSLYRQVGKHDKAQQHFEKITELQPKDIEAWIELASLIEHKNITGALTAYEKAVQLLNARKSRVPIELWNNIGVLYFQLGNYKQAEAAYNSVFSLEKESSQTNTQESSSLTKFGPGGIEFNFQARYITSLYNLARLYEATNRYSKAQYIYNGIINEHPNYIDCFMRLGCIARDKCQFFEASEKFKEIFSVSQDNPEAWTLIGNLHLMRGETSLGKKKFDRIGRSEQNKNDPYALLALGNIVYQLGVDIRKGPGSEASDREIHINKATDYYLKVLQKDSHNVYAVNGLAIVLADSGRIPQARELFLQIRNKLESDKQIHTNKAHKDLLSQVNINLAHLYFSQGQFDNAIKIYSSTLKKGYNNQNEAVLSYLSKAYFEYGKLVECKKTLIKLSHQNPSNENYRYNLALTQKASASALISTFSRPTPTTLSDSPLNSKKRLAVLKLNEIRIAIEELKNASSTFEWLSTLKTLPGRMFSTTRAAEQGKKCQEKSEILKKRLIEGEEEAKELEKLREKQLQEFQEEIKRKKEEEERQKELKKQKEEEEQRLAEEIRDRAQRMADSWAKEEKKKPERDLREKKKKRGREGSTSPRREGSSEEEERSQNKDQSGDEDSGDKKARKKRKSKESISEYRQRKAPQMERLVEKVRANKEEEKEMNLKKRRSEVLDGMDDDDRKKRKKDMESVFGTDDESEGSSGSEDESKKKEKRKKEKNKKEKKSKKKKKSESDDDSSEDRFGSEED